YLGPWTDMNSIPQHAVTNGYVNNENFRPHSAIRASLLCFAQLAASSSRVVINSTLTTTPAIQIAPSQFDAETPAFVASSCSTVCLVPRRRHARTPAVHFSVAMLLRKDPCARPPDWGSGGEPSVAARVACRRTHQDVPRCGLPPVRGHRITALLSRKAALAVDARRGPIPRTL